MTADRAYLLPGFVKVELRSRSPRLWGWSLYREGNDTAVERSGALFRHAEDAWKAGQAALAHLEPTRRHAPSEPHRAAADRRWSESRVRAAG
jgi:hypothetical protein